jgi:hypothetical protein
MMYEQYVIIYLHDIKWLHIAFGNSRHGGRIGICI